jgi:hypothetical protein
MASRPTDLVQDGVLTHHNIYRTARVSNKEKDLYTGLSKDDFPDVVRNPETSDIGFIPNCTKSITDGDQLSCDQWETLTTWHAGLSCQLMLKAPKQAIVVDVFGNDFDVQFNSAKGIVKDEVTKEKYQQFLCYELCRGTCIPNDVGIEKDGDNHVCLYPTGDENSVHDIASGDDSFAIDSLQRLVPSWRPFAILKFKAGGYQWPETFPKDTELFPIRLWIKMVILGGEADLAVSVGSDTEDFVHGRLDWPTYFKNLISVGVRFGTSCSYDQCITNVTMMNALRYAVKMYEIQTGDSRR